MAIHEDIECSQLAFTHCNIFVYNTAAVYNPIILLYIIQYTYMLLYYYVHVRFYEQTVPAAISVVIIIIIIGTI